jgi:hypothetical protein
MKHSIGTTACQKSNPLVQALRLGNDSQTLTHKSFATFHRTGGFLLKPTRILADEGFPLNPLLNYLPLVWASFFTRHYVLTTLYCTGCGGLRNVKKTDTVNATGRNYLTTSEWNRILIKCSTQATVCTHIRVVFWGQNITITPGLG